MRRTTAIRFKSTARIDRSWLLLLTTAWACCTARLPAAEPSLTAQIENVIHSPVYRHAFWGLLVVDLQSGSVLYEENADKLFAPASNTKLYSVAAALDAFGPEHQFETPIYARGKTNAAGQLEGDLILVASGDLTLGGRTLQDGTIAFKDTDHTYANGNDSAELTEPDPLAGLKDLAKQVASSGIKRVNGEVIVDARLFEPAESSGSGPSQLSPILINDNLIDLLVTPTAIGERAAVISRPRSAVIQVESQVLTVASNLALKITWQNAAHGRWTVRGQIPAGHKPVVRVLEIEEPVQFARSVLIEALREAGISVETSAWSENPKELLPERTAYQQLERVALLRSPPFREEMKLILKVSHNLHASTLPMLLAVKNGQRTLEDGLHIERDFLVRAGVDADTISFAGGAGGTRSDFTTPRATVQLLRYMAGRTDFQSYKAALPALGEDGTLASAVGKESPARGKAFAKTGTLIYDNLLNDDLLLTSKALGGYVTTSHHRELAFAIVINNLRLGTASEIGKIGQVLGRLCEMLYLSE